jgi:hypothetical protein
MSQRNPVLPHGLSPLDDVLPPDRLIAFALGSSPHARVAAVDVDDLLGAVPAENRFLLALEHARLSLAALGPNVLCAVGAAAILVG